MAKAAKRAKQDHVPAGSGGAARAGAKPASAGAAWTRLLRPAVEFVAVGAGIFGITHLFLMLGQAMWLPPERREAMQIMVTGLGMLVYGAGKLLSKAWGRWVEKRAGGHGVGGGGGEDAHGGTEALLLSHGVPACFALGAMICAFAVFLKYTELNRVCIRQFQPPAGWWERQFGEPPADEEAATGADATHASGAALHGSASHGSESPASDGVTEKVPPFLDRTHSSIFVPLPSNPDWNAYLSLRGHGDADAGLEDYLTKDPMSVVTWLQTSAGNAALASTITRLTWLHLLLVSLLAAAAGVMFSPAETLVERVVHFFH